MSIYIKGDAFYKPTACAPCKIRNWCQLWRQVDLPAHLVHPECPISEVPEHGDLIDYDFCMENYELLHDDDGNPVYAVKMRDINRAPTIIPADKEGNGNVE